MTTSSRGASNARRSVTILSISVLALMLAVTTYASLDRSILNVGRELLSDPWFLATLCDAYCGFLLFFVWVAFKERTATRRVVWLVLIMSLGNIAMSIYVLRELWRTRREHGLQSLWTPKEETSP